MANRKKKRPTAKGQAPARWPRFLIPGAVSLAILVGLATWLHLPRQGPVSNAASPHGGPRLVVDKEYVDFGPVRFERFVTARFRLKNVGDQPLRLVLDPQVEAIEGC